MVNDSSLRDFTVFEKQKMSLEILPGFAQTFILWNSINPTLEANDKIKLPSSKGMIIQKSPQEDSNFATFSNSFSKGSALLCFARLAALESDNKPL